MTVLALELNDAAIAVATAAGLAGPEPGYASVTEAGVLFGHEAWRLSRLQPRQTANRYWQHLSTASLSNPIGAFATSADLVHAHLEKLVSAQAVAPASIICAVPGYWSTEQLGLLLGIAQELTVPVLGLVDSAVAATRCEYPGQDLLHLDGALHQIVLTRLHQDGRASLGGSVDRQFVTSLGIEQLERAAATFIAGRFLEATRFDPLHDARSEQSLYDQLYGWLGELQRQDEIGLQIEFGSNEFCTSIRKEDLAARISHAFQPAVQQVRSSLGASRQVAIQISDRLATFPGVVESLARLPQAAVYALEPAAAAWGALQRAEQFSRSDGGVGLTTSLNWDHAPLRADLKSTLSAALPSTAAPTHVLYDGRVYRLSASAFNIGVELANGEYGLRLNPSTTGVSRRHCSIRHGDHGVELVDHSRFGTQLNGHVISDNAVLTTGDVISIGRPAIEIRLVSEVTDEAAARGT